MHKSGRWTAWLLLTVLSLFSQGCINMVPAEYKGMAGHTITVMTWADRSLKTDFPSVQYDVSASVQSKLGQLAAGGRSEFKGATFPVRPEAVARYQEDFPQIETMPIASVAPRLGITRLVYIEIEQLRTRSRGSWDLYRGFAQGTVRVVEVVDGKGRIAYEDRNIIAVFPRGTTEEGLPTGNDELFYRGAIHEFANQITLKFIEHEQQ